MIYTQGQLVIHIFRITWERFFVLSHMDMCVDECEAILGLLKELHLQ